MEPELIETDKKTKKNPIQGLGEYAVKGGPGRPKGALGKFSRMKHDMVKAWISENGAEKFRQLLRGEKGDFLKAVDRIIAVMPKEVDMKLDATIGPRIFIIRPGEENKIEGGHNGK